MSVAGGGRTFWALSRHEDVQKGLVNWQAFSSTRSDILEIMKSGMEMPPGVILFEDPPVPEGIAVVRRKKERAISTARSHSSPERRVGRGAAMRSVSVKRSRHHRGRHLLQQVFDDGVASVAPTAVRTPVTAPVGRCG